MSLGAMEGARVDHVCSVFVWCAASEALYFPKRGFCGEREHVHWKCRTMARVFWGRMASDCVRREASGSPRKVGNTDPNGLP